jgi:hypothetical protein
MLYYSVLHNNYRYKYILLFLNYYGGDNYSEFNPYITGFVYSMLPVSPGCPLLIALSVFSVQNDTENRRSKMADGYFGIL